MRVGTAGLVDAAVGTSVGVEGAVGGTVRGMAVGVDEGRGVGDSVGLGGPLVSSTKTQSPAPSELLPAGVNGCSPLFANGEPEIAT